MQNVTIRYCSIIYININKIYTVFVLGMFVFRIGYVPLNTPKTNFPLFYSTYKN